MTPVIFRNMKNISALSRIILFKVNTCRAAKFEENRENPICLELGKTEKNLAL